MSNVAEQELQIGAVVFDMQGQLNIHQTIGLPVLKHFLLDNHDVRDKKSIGR